MYIHTQIAASVWPPEASGSLWSSALRALRQLLLYYLDYLSRPILCSHSGCLAVKTVGTVVDCLHPWQVESGLHCKYVLLYDRLFACITSFGLSQGDDLMMLFMNFVLLCNSCLIFFPVYLFISASNDLENEKKKKKLHNDDGNE